MPQQKSPPVPQPDTAALDPIIRVFQPRMAEPISHDRAVAMRANLLGFFRELLAWKREDDEKARAAGGAR